MQLRVKGGRGGAYGLAQSKSLKLWEALGKESEICSGGAAWIDRVVKARGHFQLFQKRHGSAPYQGRERF